MADGQSEQPMDMRSEVRKRLDRVTYFAGADEEFDEATIEDFKGVVASEVEQYIERQRRDNQPINLCDFAFEIPYQLGRGDMMKEMKMRQATTFMP